MNLNVIPPRGRRLISRLSGGTIGRSARRKGDLARGEKNWLAAASHYQRHLLRRPRDYAIWVQLGHVLKEAGQIGPASSAYAKAAELRSDDPDLMMSRGHLAKRAGDLPQASKFYLMAHQSGAITDANVELSSLLAAADVARAILPADQPDQSQPSLPEEATYTAALPAIVAAPVYATPMERKRARQMSDISARLANMPPVDLTGPLISILTPVYNVEERWLIEMADSILRQTYANWELCLVDDGSTNASTRDAVVRLGSHDPRIKVLLRQNNGGISAASNDALAMSSGRYVALVDNDDILTSDALEEMVREINRTDPDWLYSDEFKVDESNVPSELFAKPDWSPLFLLNYMYTGHLTLYRRSAVLKAGGFRSQYDFSQDYDLALRMAEMDLKVAHVERYLYGWRAIEGSGAAGGKPHARISNLAALQDAADRRGWGGEAVGLPTCNRLVRSEIDHPLVSIIIPSDNIENIKTTIDSVTSKSTYKNYEIIIVTRSETIDQLKREISNAAVKWSAYDLPYNFSGKCNAGAASSSGDYLIFFNDDVRVITPDWIECHIEYLTLPGVGVVGPKLLYEDGSIQHAGIVTGVRRFTGTAFHTYPSNTSAHFNMAQCVREVSVIIGALLAMPANVFNEIGGYDALNTPINHSDVDLCFRAREAGYSCVYNPHATLVHIGHMSIGDESYVKTPKKKDTADVFLLRRWGQFIARDPFFTPAMRDLIYIDSQEEFGLLLPDDEPYDSSNLRSVAIISHDLTGSGAPKVALDLAVTLKSSGMFVVVFSPTDGPMRQRLLDAGIAVVVDELILTGHDAATAPLSHFDIVIANTIVCWRTVSAISDLVPVYWYTHETALVDHFAAEPGFKEALLKPAAIWSGSRLAAEALEPYGADPLVLEYGVEDASDALAQVKIRVGLFGSYEPRKGQDLAVEAMLLLPPEVQSRIHFVAYGRTLDAGFRDAIGKKARGLATVALKGELSYGEYLASLRECDVVLVPSRDDTLPLVSLDALSFAKTLVVSRQTGTSAYLKDGVSAVILEHNSPQDIAAALTRLLADDGACSRIGKAGRKVFLKKFTVDSFAKRLDTALAMPVRTASA